MKIAHIERSFSNLSNLIEEITEPDVPSILQQALSELRTTKSAYDEARRQSHHPGQIVKPWGYTIYPSQPIKFTQSSEIKGFDAQVEVFGEVRWMTEETLPVKQAFVIRVWSAKLAFRKGIDDTEIETEVKNRGGRRVILRYHFDRANKDQDGPTFHLQFGGNADEHELFWFPEIAKLPRIINPPMDLVLICQLVAANFYSKAYGEFKNTPEWKTMLRRSENAFLKPFFDKCTEFFRDEASFSLLDRLSNLEWMP